MDRDTVKRGLWLLMGVSLSLGLLAVLFVGVPLKDVRLRIAEFPAWSLLGSAGLIMLSIPFRAHQWYLLLGDWKQLTWNKVFRAICFGHVGNLVLPLRGGELIKIGMLARTASIPLERVLASVIVCRAQDLLPMALVFVIFVMNADIQRMEAQLGLEQGALFTTANELASSTSLHVGILSILTLAVAFLWFVRAKFKAPRNLRTISWVHQRFDGVLGALRTAGNPRSFTFALVAALASWILFTVSAIPLLLGLGLSVFDALRAALAIAGAVTFLQLLPSAPTAAGTVHFGCSLALASVAPQLESSQILAFAIVLHALGAFVPAIPGIFLTFTLFPMAKLSRYGNMH